MFIDEHSREDVQQLTDRVKALEQTQKELEQALEGETGDKDILWTIMWHAIGFSARVFENALHQVRGGESAAIVVSEIVISDTFLRMYQS